MDNQNPVAPETEQSQSVQQRSRNTWVAIGVLSFAVVGFLSFAALRAIGTGTGLDAIDGQISDGASIEKCTGDAESATVSYLAIDGECLSDTTQPTTEPTTEPTATPAAGTPFSFTAAGDFGVTSETNAVLAGMGSAGADFALALGDLSYQGNGSENSWCDLVKGHVGDDYPFELIVGNHDDGSSDGDISAYVNCLPDRIGNIVGTYGIEYYFDYGDLARFINIAPAIDNYGFDYGEGSAHYQWVADAIDDAREDGLSWIFLNMHKNCMNPGGKSCEIGADIINLAIEKNVDFVLQGHEHAYHRSKQLAHGPDCEEIVADAQARTECIGGEGNDLVAGDGTIIVVTGLGGHSIRNIITLDPEAGYFDEWNGSNTGNSFGFSQFEVTAESITASFVPVAGGTYMDSFTVTKP